MTNDNLYIIHNGKINGILNGNLLVRQRAYSNLEGIKACHITKLDIYDAIRSTDDPKRLKEYASDLTLCEFELQKLWNFPEDIKFHRFWETPKCTCPKLDNIDNYPSGYYSVSMGCPIHS